VDPRRRQTVRMMLHHVPEADWIRWVGVGVAIVGTLVAAPTGTALVRDLVIGGIRKGSKAVLAAVRPAGKAIAVGIWHVLVAIWLVAKATLHIGLPTGIAGDLPIGLGDLLVRARAASDPFAWDDEATLDVKVTVLHEQIGHLLKYADGIRREALAMNATLADADSALRKQLRAKERREARVSARGVVLIGFGIVLTGIPDGLAKFAVVGWLVVGVVIAWTLWTVWTVLWGSDVGLGTQPIGGD
jgi:hypothetical protein